MNLKKIEEIALAYAKTQEIRDDIKEIEEMAQLILENKEGAFVSVDIASTNETNLPPKQSFDGINYTYTFTQPLQATTIGFSIEVPDSSVLEVLGVLLRAKQQQLKQMLNGYDI